MKKIKKEKKYIFFSKYEKSYDFLLDDGSTTNCQNQRISRKKSLSRRKNQDCT